MNKNNNQSNLLVKECLVTALLKLTKEKTLSSISISELCLVAGVSRMAYYRNYDSIDEIFLNHLADLFRQYKNDYEKMKDNGTYCDNKHLKHYFEYIYTNRDFLDGLIMCGFDNKFLQMLNDYILEQWGEHENKYTLISFTGSIYNLFCYWSSNDYKDKYDEMINTLMERFN